MRIPGVPVSPSRQLLLSPLALPPPVLCTGVPSYPPAICLIALPPGCHPFSSSSRLSSLALSSHHPASLPLSLLVSPFCELLRRELAEVSQEAPGQTCHPLLQSFLSLYVAQIRGARLGRMAHSTEGCKPERRPGGVELESRPQGLGSAGKSPPLPTCNLPTLSRCWDYKTEDCGSDYS